MKGCMRVLFMVFILAFVSSCGKQVAKCTDPTDNPSHHYLMGMQALEEKKIDVAQSKFERANFCDEKFSPAHDGLAIVSAYKIKKQADAGFKKVETERAMQHLKKAGKLAESAEDKFDHLVATMRVYSAIKPTKDWLKTAEDAFSDIRNLKVEEKKLTYYQGKEAADYFMGKAYLNALEFRQARDKFADVLNAKREGKWNEKADKAHKRVDKIVRAMAGITVGDVGKQIAVKDSVTRADLAALLIVESSFPESRAMFKKVRDWEYFPKKLREAGDVLSLRQRIRQVMWKKVGIVRTAKGLGEAKVELGRLRAEVDRLYIEAPLSQELIALRHLVRTAQIIAYDAGEFMNRKLDSMGGHLLVED